MYLKKNGKFLFVASMNYGIYRLEKDSSDWIRLNTFRPRVTCMTFNDSNMFVGTIDSGVYISKNNGVTLQRISNGLGSLKLNAIEYNKGVLYAGTKDSGVFRSYDEGLNWHSVNTNSKQKNVVSIISVDTFVLIGMEYEGVYYTSNYSMDLKEINFGLDDNTVSSLSLVDSFVYAGIHGFGLYKLLKFNLTTALTSLENNQSRINLYPNPNNGIFTIEIDNEFDYFEIRDFNGKLIHTIKASQNETSNKIDVSNYGNGIYFITVYFGSSKEVRMFIVN